MADAGAMRDPARLPWLEPYRAPPRKPSNRRSGVTAAIGAVGMAAVVTLLARDLPWSFETDPPAPQASVALPPPEDLQPQIVLPELRAAASEEPVVEQEAARLVRPAARPRRRISAVPTSAAYREVVREQAEPAPAAEPQVSEAALAIAALPIPPDPPRPAVNRSAQLVRGKTVQLGVFRTAREAELVWRSAIRDYTYLVTMPKSIEPISLRSRRFYRLQLGTPSMKHARQLCTNLKSIGRPCTVA